MSNKFITRTIISALIIFSLLSCATAPAINNEKVQKVITLENMTATSIFAKTQLWTSNTFVSAKDAIELADKESGILTIRTTYNSNAYAFGSIMGGKYYTTYKIVIEIKDNKARITCQNPQYEVFYQGRTQPMTGSIDSFNKEFVSKANEIIASYEKYITEKTSSW